MTIPYLWYFSIPCFRLCVLNEPKQPFLKQKVPKASALGTSILNILPLFFTYFYLLPESAGFICKDDEIDPT